MLYRFAHFPAAKNAKVFHKLRLDELISRLQLNSPEDLKFVDDEPDPNPRPFGELIGYIFHSFKHNQKLQYSPDREYVMFDPSFRVRVVDRPDEKIYMFFGKNPIHDQQEWSFRGWYIGWDQFHESTKRFIAPECVICTDKPRNAVLVHGNTSHFICCLTCAQNLVSCPMCTKPIDKAIQCWMNQ